MILLDVLRARKRIAPYIVRTPLVRSSWLSDAARADVSLKLESLQVSSSFKSRGAFNAVIARLERSSGTLQTMAADARICRTDIEIARVGTASSAGNQPSPNRVWGEEAPDVLPDAQPPDGPQRPEHVQAAQDHFAGPTGSIHGMAPATGSDSSPPQETVPGPASLLKKA